MSTQEVASKVHVPYTSTAVVTWFNPVKGYGFVKADKTGESVFVYHENIVMDGFRYLDDGQKVECLVVNTDKGLSGMKVTPLEG